VPPPVYYGPPAREHLSLAPLSAALFAGALAGPRHHRYFYGQRYRGRW
jgi:hypothetical protein